MLCFKVISHNSDDFHIDNNLFSIILLCFKCLVKKDTSSYKLVTIESVNFMMVTELSGVQFGLKPYTWFEIVRVWIEITSVISDQNCTTQSSITTLLQPFRNRRIQSVPVFYWSSGRFDEKHKQKGFYTSFCIIETEMMWYRAKMVWFKTEMILI